MSQQDRHRWDTRYQKRNRLDYPSPDDLLVRHAPAGGNQQFALDIACGRGQNSLYLGEIGYQVLGIDISDVGLQAGRDEMARCGLKNVTFVQADLDHYPLPKVAYDLVCVFFFLNREIIPAIKASVRPGGMVIYETFNRRLRTIRPQSTPEYLLESGELPTFFDDWETVFSQEAGTNCRYVGCKPSSIVGS